MNFSKILSTDIFASKPDIKDNLKDLNTIPSMYFDDDSKINKEKMINVMVENNHNSDYYMKLSNLVIITHDSEQKFKSTTEYNKFFNDNPGDFYKYKYLIDNSKYINGNINSYNDKFIKIKVDKNIIKIENDILNIYKSIYKFNIINNIQYSAIKTTLSKHVLNVGDIIEIKIPPVNFQLIPLAIELEKELIKNPTPPNLDEILYNILRD